MKEYPYSILRFFEYEHLPEKLQAVSKRFHDLAWASVEGRSFTANPTDAETAAGLRKLLEAKDCIVRGSLDR